MKYIAAALVFTALCAWGLYKAAALKKRTACLETVRCMLESCAQIIERKGCDAGELLRELSATASLVRFSFLNAAYGEMLGGMSFADAFFSCSHSSGELDCLNSEDRQLLDEYIYQFSAASRENLLKKSREYADLFLARAQSAGDYSVKNGRLYIAAGVLCGMLVAVVVL